MSRVEGTMSRVEGNNFFNFFFFLKMGDKWKTNKKNLKNKWRVDISPSTLVLLVGWGGGGNRTRYLITGFSIEVTA